MWSGAPVRRGLEPRGRRLRIGLLGGSFNPAHAGHRHLSLTALRLLGLDQVWWLVAPQNPLKPAKGMARYADRLEGAARVADHPRIVVTDIEDRIDTRYTVDTVEKLRHRFRDYRFVWLMGADNLVQLPKWDRWERLPHLVPVAVFDRAPYSYSALSGQAASRFRRFLWQQADARALPSAEPPALLFVRMKRHPLSATQLRMEQRRNTASGSTAADRPSGREENDS